MESLPFEPRYIPWYEIDKRYRICDQARKELHEHFGTDGIVATPENLLELTTFKGGPESVERLADEWFHPARFGASEARRARWREIADELLATWDEPWPMDWGERQEREAVALAWLIAEPQYLRAAEVRERWGQHQRSAAARILNH